MSLALSVGVGSEADVYRAGQAAARQMLEHLGGRPQLTLVFSSIRFADPRLLEGIRTVTEGAPLIGCTDAGGISTWGLAHQSVTVIGLRGEDVSFPTAVANGVSRDPEMAGKHLAQTLHKKTLPQEVKAILILPDGLSGNGSALLRGVQKGWGSNVPVVGGSAGDDFYFQRTFQYFDDEILTDSVPGVLFCGDLGVGLGVRHGWVPLGRPRRVTKAKGHVVYQIDDKPAVSIYESYLGVKRQTLMRHPLAQTAFMYPLGISQGEGEEYLLRGVLRVGEQSSLICSGEIRQGSWIRLMIGGYESALAAARESALQAAHALDLHRLKGALVFSSVGRQKMLGSESQGEIDIIRDSLGGIGVCLGGFYGYGEQAPLDSANTFHNESVVVMALG